VDKLNEELREAEATMKFRKLLFEDREREIAKLNAPVKEDESEKKGEGESK